MRRILLSALFIVVSFSLFAAGPFALDAKRDSLALSLGLGAELLVKYSDPGFDSWDGSTLDRGDINALDRFFAHGYREIPDNISNATALLSMAMPLVNLKDSRDEWKTLTVMFSETLVYTNLTCDSIKRLVGRDRPYMYYSTKSKTGDDRMCSFPSLHTACAFAGATFATYTYAKYNPDSKYRFHVAAASYAIASVTGALRIAAGKHFLSDVLTGAAIGSFWGYAVPKLHEISDRADNKVLSALDIAPGYVGFTVALN